ncbi:dipeptide/oligopeptide/nickel ABC transporter permease/ATP-binding protein [Arthrobacter sp. 2MCAF15]|uniref:dipeptide/oligopeptide/nickel ABC transporter permease/ATP-binding protein n=1 Tax=Arthrobacter sp. 2MCAF15 TaxID=3232984 RepID=UPI003F938A7A
MTVTNPQAGGAAGISSAVLEPPRPGVIRRLLRDKTALLCLAYLGLAIAASIAAPLFTSASPTASQIANALAPAGGEHPLGTDGVGRDVLAQLLYGGRTSLTGSLIVAGMAVLLGLPAGVIAGYYKGAFDAVASWISSLLMAAPAIVVLLVVLAQFGRSTELAMTVFGVIIAPAVFRLVRSSVVAVREELYVDAARVSGLGDGRIMVRHVLPVVVAPTIIQTAQLAGIAVAIQAGLDFLGLGSANQASWGGMLSDAFQNVYTSPQLLLWPGLAIILTVTAFSLLGTSLRDVLEGGTSRPPRSRPNPAPQTFGGATVIEAAEGGATGRPATDALLEVVGLKVGYPKADGSEGTVVHGIDISLRRGEILALVGESGSGKSQTAFSVLGLLPANARTSASRMIFDGVDLRECSAAAMNQLRGKRIGYIPQEPMSNLDPAFRIGSQLTEPMRHHLGMSRAEAKSEAIRLLERVGITQPGRVFDAYPHQISGGMAQRVLIAGAVSCNPDLLIADEPTTALDVTVQAEVLDLIRELQSERNMGVILVTHNFGVVADLADRVAVMQRGRIVETATAEALFASPRHEYTRELLAASLEDTTPASAGPVGYSMLDAGRPAPRKEAQL